MKNKGRFGFVAVCFMICILPFAGMMITSDYAVTENRKLADFPQIVENKEWNVDFLQDAGAYFEDHFAFRTFLVSVDAEILSRIFCVSNVDTVTVGTEGWLYYTATVDDYQNRNLMSDKAVKNAAYNLALIYRYMEQKGAECRLLIAPNKNSLYGENMPWYLQKKAEKAGNMDRLLVELGQTDIPYVDLFSLFAEEDEILYLKRDSHWNRRGAVLVYNALMDSLGLDHENYETVQQLRLKDEYGDLNKMLYPLTAEPEWNYIYQKENTYHYKTDTKSVEDAWIETENEEGEGSLLMYRDSFGNTLLPLFADEFSHGYFSKGEPWNITKYMEKYCPDVVILEKVQRNIRDFAENPPLMEGPEAAVLPESVIKAESETSLTVSECEEDAAFWKISGVLDESFLMENPRVYVRITGDEQKVYEAFLVSDKDSDNGYQIYLPKEKFYGKEVKLEVLVEGENILSVQEKTGEICDGM